MNEEVSRLTEQDIELLFQEAKQRIHNARANVVKSVNQEQIIAYWHIGRIIFEKEQKDRKKKFWDLFSFGQEVDTDFEHKRSSISKIQQLEIHRRVSIINNLASTRRFTTRA